MQVIKAWLPEGIRVITAVTHAIIDRHVKTMRIMLKERLV